LSVEEFLVDFLGGLVPGVLFFTASSVVVIPLLHATLREQGKTNYPDLGSAIVKALSATQHTPGTLWFAVLLIVLLLAYVVGHLFYRHDPNGPDRRSFRYLARRPRYRNKTKRVALLYRAWLWLRRPWELDDRKLLRADLGCDSIRDCQFPYPHYDEYLKVRGLHYLLPWVQWTKTKKHRSKNYINRLKIMLRQNHPDRCASIVRNEAHVRLASSTWYVARVLLVLSLSGLVWLSLLVWARVSSQSDTLGAVVVGDFLPEIACSSIVVVFSLYARFSIARFLHYQRMREVYYVLEIALVTLLNPPPTTRPSQPEEVTRGRRT
jgi:hypothetical protein